MKNLNKLLTCLILLFASISLFAQSNSNGIKTYQLDLKTLSTEYKNILGLKVPQALHNELTLDWRQVTNGADYTIKVQFIEGLDPKQYTRKKDKNGHYYFQVYYRTPQYMAVVSDREGNLLFDKIFGKEEVSMPYGKEENYTDTKALATKWRFDKEDIYKETESSYNHVDAFMPTLLKILSGENIEESNDEEVLEIADAEEEVVVEAEPEGEKNAEPIAAADERNEPVNDSKAELGEEEKAAVVTTVIVETPEERRKRLEEESRKFEEMEQEEIEKRKARQGRLRRARVGVRLLTPNVVGVHGEVVLPAVNNQLSLVGDFSRISVVGVFDRFLDDGLSIAADGDAYYQYYSAGLNYYFRKKYARGWYLGASYLKATLKTEATDFEGKVEIDAAAVRLGLNMGKKIVMFGFEVGAGVPLSKLEGTVITVDENDLEEVDVIDEKIPLIPILNLTVSIAL